MRYSPRAWSGLRYNCFFKLDDGRDNANKLAVAEQFDTIGGRLHVRREKDDGEDRFLVQAARVHRPHDSASWSSERSLIDK